ncbi:MAG: hypothetical protein JWM59_510 [Verrucomicrobiales bacterium]|nr:hypothetical protein [Verrucomicrobiales bacterium]
MDRTENPGHWQKLLVARVHLPIPGPSDFYLEPGGDAAFAWQMFGGLSLEEAYVEFLKDPWLRQEDFSWMLPKAFEYYYPVVDRYLRSVNIHDEDECHEDGCEARGLGFSIESQFHWTGGARPADYVVREIRRLSLFVRGHLSHYSKDPEERARIDESWRKLDETVSQTGVS